MAFVFPIMFFVVSVGIGIGISGSILVAQYEGARRREKVNYVAAQTFTFAFFAALVLSVLGYFSSGFLVELLGADSEVAPLAEGYLKIIFSGIVLIFAFFIFTSMMRAWGDTRTPMRIMVASNLLNMILDPVLIFGIGFFPSMGIKGAALATVFSRLIASAVGIYILLKRDRGLHIVPKNLKPDLAVIKKIFKLGWPAVMEHASRAMGMMVLTAVVAGFGTVAVAAYSVGIRVFSIFIMPSVAVSMSVASVVGQNLGAGFKERVKTATWKSAVAVFVSLAFISLFVYWGRFNLAGIFLSSDGRQVLGTAASFLTRIALGAPFLGAAIILRGAFKGAGRTFQSMLLALIGLFGFRVVLAYVLAVTSGSSTGIWNAFVFASIGELVLCALYYYHGRWVVPVVGKPEISPAMELLEKEI
jgi:putative MATE family efflux protein